MMVRPRTFGLLMTWTTPQTRSPPNGLTLSRANRTRDRSTYDDEAAVGVGCSVELDGRFTHRCRAEVLLATTSQPAAHLVDSSDASGRRVLQDHSHMVEMP
jgi:hypothetical protein